MQIRKVCPWCDRKVFEFGKIEREEAPKWYQTTNGRVRSVCPYCSNFVKIHPRIYLWILMVVPVFVRYSLAELGMLEDWSAGMLDWGLLGLAIVGLLGGIYGAQWLKDE